MSEKQQLTDYQRAGMVARYVEIQDVSLKSVEGDLLVSKEQVLAEAEWFVSQDRATKFRLDEAKKELWVEVKLTATVRGGDKDDLIRCSGTFVVTYIFNAPEPLPLEERDAYLSAFANINAVFNVWPYFRELVQSTVARMGVPPLVLSVYRIAPPASRPIVQPAQAKVTLRPVEDEAPPTEKRRRKV